MFAVASQSGIVFVHEEKLIAASRTEKKQRRSNSAVLFLVSFSLRRVFFCCDTHLSAYRTIGRLHTRL